jgi:hypothetical protein
MMTDTVRNIIIPARHGEPLYTGKHFAIYEATFPARAEFGEQVFLDGYTVWNIACDKSDGEYRGIFEARAVLDHWERGMSELDEDAPDYTFPLRAGNH